MPASTPCPIADVDRALAAYINTREDTLRIRRTLSRYLTSSLRPVNSATQNQHLNHENPQALSAAHTNPPGLKDARLEYLQALRAKNLAQAKHKELQNSLQDIQNRHVDETPIQADFDYNNEITRGYMCLLRQRQRYAELQIIQNSLDKLISAKPLNAHVDPKTTVKDAIGEQPDLPAERLELLSRPQDDQSWVLKLKQEVLEARASMERSQSAREKAQAESRGNFGLQRQVHALELARDEMVEWVQGELVKMEEDSVFLEDASPMKRAVKDDSPLVDLSAAESQIRASYDHYTASRASVLEAYICLHNPSSAQVDAVNESETVTQGAAQPQDKPSMPTAKLLPHLPRLAQIAGSDRSLLQQSVYLQAQIASADQDIEEALIRLSGESHMLSAGLKDVSAWAKTAREAETTTDEGVKEHVQSSRQELASVSTIVELCSLQGEMLAAV